MNICKNKNEYSFIHFTNFYTFHKKNFYTFVNKIFTCEKSLFLEIYIHYINVDITAFVA